MDDERPPSHSRKMWLRFGVAALLIAGLSGGATATVALNEVEGLGGEIFKKGNTVKVKAGLIDLASAYQTLSNEEWAMIDEVKIIMGAKGVAR